MKAMLKHFSPTRSGPAHPSQTNQASGSGPSSSIGGAEKAKKSNWFADAFTRSPKPESSRMPQISGPTEAAAGPVERRPTESLQALQRMADGAPQGSTLKTMLNDVLRGQEKVSAWNNTGGSGNVVPKFGGSNGASASGHTTPSSYIVNYKTESSAGDTNAHVAHELTHISAYESYKRDGVNFPGHSTPPERRFPEGAREGFQTNEHDRQQAQRDSEMERRIHRDLFALQTAAEDSNFPPDLKKKIVDKLNYGAQAPHLEYQTVLNQSYLWLHGHEGGLDSRFGRMLDDSVGAANASRAAARTGGTYPAYPPARNDWDLSPERLNMLQDLYRLR